MNGYSEDLREKIVAAVGRRISKSQAARTFGVSLSSVKRYVKGIDRLLRDALVEDGWKVGFYTGEDKSGLDGFLEGDVDVLIGSSAIGTGVDGLQRVCNR